MEEKKLKKRTFNYWMMLEILQPEWGRGGHQTIAFVLSYCNLHIFHYFLFFILYFILLFTSFLLFMIFFTTFYSWMILEILQILLLMSYKLACHRLQKIISNIYSLYFLSNTNHILTQTIYKYFSSYKLVIFVYLF